MFCYIAIDNENTIKSSIVAYRVLHDQPPAYLLDFVVYSTHSVTLACICSSDMLP